MLTVWGWVVRVSPWFNFRGGMRASICCIAALMGAMGIATEAAAVEGSDAGLAGKRGPLLFATGQQAAAMEERGQNAGPDPVVQTSAQREHVLGVCDVVNVNA